jgi:hypothetical protein
VPAGALVGGRIVDVGGVSSALRQLLARVEITDSRAMIAVSDSLASFRVLRFPSDATDEAIDAAATRELPTNPQRMASRWVDLREAERRVVFAALWDRALVQKAVDAARGAGLDPAVVELKSTCIARAVAEPRCVVVDIAANPVEIFVIEDHLPQLWHSFELNAAVGDDIGAALAGPLRQVLRFHGTRRDGGFKGSAPILISGEQTLSSQALAHLQQTLGHPVQPLPVPPRVPEDVRHGTYLACLGMLMRRSQ